MKPAPEHPAASRPFVLLNMAMTADGKIATANRKISSFGTPRDQRHLYELRATVDAVMSGARTVDLNPVTLGNGGARFEKLRRRGGLAPCPLRVVVSGSGSLDPDAAIFQRHFSPILVLASGRATKPRLAALRRVADEVRVFGRGDLDFAAALRWLHRQHGVRRLLCEGGGELNDALFRAGLVDELHLTICPLVFGGRSAPTIADGLGFARLADAFPLELVSQRRVGDELFLVYARAEVAQQPTPRAARES